MLSMTEIMDLWVSAYKAMKQIICLAAESQKRVEMLIKRVEDESHVDVSGKVGLEVSVSRLNVG